ncbi:MAG: nuclear transport factor 2 family protein [Actinomycetota bacterium]
MAEHPNVSVVRRLNQAFISRDTATLFHLVGENLELHVPGRSPFAGRHRGPEKILAVFHESGKLAGHSFKLKLHALLGGDDHVVALQHITGARNGRVLDQDSGLVCHIKDGKLVDVWVFLSDVRQFDEFWS